MIKSFMRRKGFTFIELLVAISIFSVIAVSIYYAFSTGVFAWRRLSTATESYQKATLALELMGNEIAGYIPSNTVKMEGAKDRIAFLADLTDIDNPGLYKISFFLDSAKNTIMRSSEDFKSVLNSLAAQGTTENIKGRFLEEEFLPDAKAIEFKYYCKNPAGENANQYEWKDSLGSDCKAVSISITLFVKKETYSQAQQNEIKFTRVIPLYQKNENDISQTS